MLLNFVMNLYFSIKLGVMEDHSNRTRLAKLLRFFSSNSDTEQTSLEDYLERMKEKQEHIYFMAGSNRQEVRGVYVRELPYRKKDVIFKQMLVLFKQDGWVISVYE